MTEVYAEIDRICANDGTGINGWCTSFKGRWLADHVVREGLIHCVEIGVFGGRSLLSIALGVKHLARGGYALGIDPYTLDRHIEGVGSKPDIDWAKRVDYEAVYQQALTDIRKRGLGSHCGIVRAASEEVAGLVGTIDLLHIDGAHSIIASCRDVEVWVPKLRPGAICILDDSTWPSIQPARAMLASMCEPPVEPEAGCGWEAYRKL